MNFCAKKIKLLLLWICCVGFLTGCNFFLDVSQKEEIIALLPEWSCDGDSQSRYPPLSRWEISIYSCDEEKIVYTNGNYVKLTVNKDENVSVLAKPVTLACGRDSFYETDFFYPAGAIYPYSKNEDGTMNIKWEHGYAAECLKKLFNGGKENSLSHDCVENFVRTFNWKKLMVSIEEKIHESLADENCAVYNPWLLDSQMVLSKLSERTFYASYLNLKGWEDFDLTVDSVFDSCFFDAENEWQLNENSLFSKFVLENECLCEKKKIKVKKGTSNYLAYANSLCFVLSLDSDGSEKKLLKDTVLLPIYFERL